MTPDKPSAESIAKAEQIIDKLLPNESTVINYPYATIAFEVEQNIKNVLIVGLALALDEARAVKMPTVEYDNSDCELHQLRYFEKLRALNPNKYFVKDGE